MKHLRECQAHQIELEAKIEELRSSREELEASRNKYALLYDFAPVGYFTLNRDGVIQTVNLTGERLLGIERPALVSRRFENFVADEDRFVFANFIRTVFGGQGKETCRLRLLKDEPQPLFVRIEAKASESGDECLAVLVDITEKKKAEQALAESEYNLAKAQSMTHVGSWSFDPATAEVNASDELLRIMRLNREETTQEAFAGVVHPEDLENVMEHLRLGVVHGKSYEIEHRLRFPDGTTRWVYTIVEPSVNSAGVVVKLYGTTQDITERKQAEVELQNKTNELQAIFDSISDGITVYDQNSLVQHHNLISPQLYPGEIMPGKSCRGIFHPDTPSLPQDCPVERALHGERVEASQVCVREGQKTRYLDITATPIKDALGEKNRALVFFRDISEKRLQEMHLIQTEKMSSIGVLATGIAHEINNPLTSVAGCAEALLRRFRDEPALKEDCRLDVFPHYLEVIVRESYRCKGIIDNLLSFGRKSDGSAIAVDMNAVLLEILELLRHQPSYRQIEVVTYLKRDLPRVLGDPSGLRQVCMNLLVNAHQAIKGSGLVEVTTDTLDNATISITIRDTGCGIAQDTIDRIWDPFFTTKEVGKGVGLGLALTYDIVKRHGGEIRVDSRIGEGSQFTVLLPVWREHSERNSGGNVNISKFVAPEIIFGRGSLSQIGESMVRLGVSKAFLVSDEGVINAGWVDQAVHYLRAAGLGTEIFSSLSTNPKDFEVTEGVVRYQASGCDGIVAVGGGSPTDVAKAIATLATNGGELQDYEGINKITVPLPPMVIAPSTAGAGSEVSQFTIIVDTMRKLKMSIISRSLVPDIAIVDPELLKTKDAKLAAATGLDALTHGIESYLSLAATPLTDIHALQAIRLISRNLVRAVSDRQDMEANANMSMAALTAGLAFSNAILGAAHAMTHQVDGLIDQHHGETNASILPHVMEFNLSASPERFRDIAITMGEDVGGMDTLSAAELSIGAVKRLIADVGLDKGLAQIGLREEFIPLLSRNAMRDACLVTNPRKATCAEIEAIFRKAM